MQLVRRYTKVLREKQAEYRGPRIGARERRAERMAATAAVDEPASVTLSAATPQQQPAV